MTDKEKADCLIELLKEQMNHFKQTRDIEFKVNIALWTVIVLAGYYLDLEICIVKWYHFIIYFGIAFIITYFHYRLWISPISKSEKIDLHYITEYRDRVEELTGEKSIPYNNKIKDDQNKRIRNWIFFELGITDFLLIILGVLFWL